MDVHTRQVSVVNSQGLHARPCHAVVSTALGFQASLRVRCGSLDVNGKSILELMTLNASCGKHLELTAEGPDSEGLLQALEELFASGFGEEQSAG